MYKLIFLLFINSVQIFAVNYPAEPLPINLATNGSLFCPMTNIKLSFFSVQKRHGKLEPDILTPTGKSKTVIINYQLPIKSLKVNIYNCIKDKYEVLNVENLNFISNNSASFKLKFNNKVFNEIPMDKRKNYKSTLEIILEYFNYKPVVLNFDIECKDHKFDSSNKGLAIKKTGAKKLDYKIKLSPINIDIIEQTNFLHNLPRHINNFSQLMHSLKFNPNKLPLDQYEQYLEKMYQEQTLLIEKAMNDAEADGRPFITTSISDENNMDESL